MLTAEVLQCWMLFLQTTAGDIDWPQLPQVKEVMPCLKHGYGDISRRGNVQKMGGTKSV